VRIYLFRQHDSQEFLRAMVLELHNDMNTIKSSPKFTYCDQDLGRLSNHQQSIVAWNRYKRYDNSPIIDLFGGQLESVVTCKTCGNRSATYDTFLDLSLSVINSLGQPHHSIRECLETYFREELLEALYHCMKCGQKRQATKKLSISRYPQILVLRICHFN
jgi:ubiquitin carboxyl-terminal hydrolase 2/21